MSLQLKVIYAHQLPTPADSTIVTVPSGKAYLVKSIVLANSGSTGSNINLKFKISSGTSVRIMEKDYLLAAC
jgi:hypothetical protein